MKLNDLIGKKFRRNVYGLSLWEDTVTEVWLQYNYLYHENKVSYCRPVTMIKGSIHSFPLDEIVIAHQMPSSVIDKLFRKICKD